MAPAKRSALKLRRRSQRGSIVSFDCVPVIQGKYRFAIFAAKTSIIRSLLSISRRQEDQDSGYQRHFSPSRVRAIANYITSHNTIPLSILVSFDEGEISTDGKRLTVPNRADAGWIIDGQHRYLGALEALKDAKYDLELPFVAFVGLNEDEQIHQFVTINREAKGVPTSLYYDLLPRLKIKKSSADLARERAADLAHVLRRDEESPFFNRIVVTTSPKRGELSLNNFVRKVYPLILEGRGPLAIYSEHEQVAVLVNYYRGLQEVFPREFDRQNSKFFQTLGFGALMNALPTFFSISVANYQGFTKDNAKSIFREINHFDFSTWNSLGTGSAAETSAGEDLKTELTAALETKKSSVGRLRT